MREFWIQKDPVPFCEEYYGAAYIKQVSDDKAVDDIHVIEAAPALERIREIEAENAVLKEIMYHHQKTIALLNLDLLEKGAVFDFDQVEERHSKLMEHMNREE